MNTKRLNSGFTLIETLIVIVLFALTATVIVNLFLGQNGLYRYYTAEVKSTGRARLALDRIDMVARESDAVLASYNFGGTDYFSGTDTLILRQQSIDNSDNFVSGSFDYTVFFRDPSDPRTLRELTEVGALSKRQAIDRVLSSSIESFTLTYDSPSFSTVENIDIEITASENFSGSTATTTIFSSVKLRNQ